MIPLRGKYISLIHVLNEKGILDIGQANALLISNTEESFLSSLIDNNYTTEDEMIALIYECYAIPYAELGNIDINLSSYMPYSIAQKYHAVPFKQEGNKLYVAMKDPLDRYAIEDIKIFCKMDVIPFISHRAKIAKAIDILYRDWNVENAILDYQREESQKYTDHYINKDPIPDYNILSAPIVRVFDDLIARGIEEDASDIHIEPFEEHSRIRFRIDGDLHNIMTIPNSVHEALISRIKILAELDIAQNRQPQDGRVMIVLNEEEVDIRISIIPTIFGEKAVLRLLNKHRHFFTKEMLGLSKAQMDKLITLLNNPNGMLLVTGPAGSGKTTTLYAMLNELNDGTRNIITIEDPVEYTIYGINQMQVNRKIGFNFASGLRAALRQDPDIIMVGEIRDRETAEIGIRSAITGHLVLSTLHTNNAVGAMFRLIDMGVEQYLLVSSIIGVISQRLLKVLCSKCKEAMPPSQYEIQILKSIGLNGGIPQLYRPVGCPFCNFRGYKGRTAVFEILTVTEQIKHALSKGIDEVTLTNLAIQSGMKTINNQCLTLLLQGVTNIDEVLKTIYSNDLIAIGEG